MVLAGARGLGTWGAGEFVKKWSDRIPARLGGNVLTLRNLDATPTGMESTDAQRLLNRADFTVHKIIYSAVDEKTEAHRSR